LPYRFGLQTEENGEERGDKSNHLQQFIPNGKMIGYDRAAGV
jgi:hypothetical protein